MPPADIEHVWGDGTMSHSFSDPVCIDSGVTCTGIWESFDLYNSDGTLHSSDEISISGNVLSV